MSEYKNLKIFVLEDNSERQAWFQRHFDTIDFCWNAEIAIEMLRSKEYDMVFLDHDLNEKKDYQGNGCEVVCAIADENLCPTSTIVIHSCNEHGSKDMVETLKEVGRLAFRLPFPMMRKVI